MLNRRIFGVALAAAASIIMAAATPAPADERVNVFAASSLKNALDAVATSWQADAGKQAAITYAGSSALAKQIEAGAPADIFVSADLDWMNYLDDRKLLAPGTTVNLLGNDIVLIAPTAARLEAIAIDANTPLAAMLGNGRLAMGDVKAVPAGKYGKAALETLGLWSTVEARVAQAENVRAALKLVATGEAALGIVYQTDARAEPSVKVLGIFPAGSHQPIVYPAAQLTSAGNAAAVEFMAYLRSAKAKAIFEQQGFTYLPTIASN